MAVDRLWDDQSNVVIRESLEPLVPVFELITHLGDGAVLLVAGILIYWFGQRTSLRDRAFVIAVGTAALALSAGIKGVFTLPRPELAFAPAYYPGYTFPSAHAMGAAAFYGALAVMMKTGRRSQRIAVASVIIGLVMLSRVVMGVHFLGDVLVGAGLGVTLVWLGMRWREEGQFRPGPMFVLAGIIAGVTAFLGARVFVSLTIGASFGGAVGWYAIANRETSNRGAAILVVGLGGLVALGGLRLVVIPFGVPFPGGGAPLLFIAETVGFTLLTCFVIVTPALAVVIEDHPTVRYLQDVLPFRDRIVELDAAAVER